MATVVKIKSDILSELFRSFLTNVPDGELMALASQLEQAHWHYLDLMRPDDASLPACSLKEFTAAVLQFMPSLTRINPHTLIDKWKAFKHTRPVRGAILLNTDLTKCVLVQGYPASTSWSFPKGKKENGETDMQAAVREVYEEVGYRIDDMVREDWYLEVKHKDLDSRMYIVTNISEATNFEPVARKEIRRIKWFNLKDLPAHRHDETSKSCLKLSANKFYIVVPYIGALRQWIGKHKKQIKNSKSSSNISKTNTSHAPDHTLNHTPSHPTNNYILESPLPFTPSTYYTLPSSHFNNPFSSSSSSWNPHTHFSLNSSSYFSPSSPYTPSSYFTPSSSSFPPQSSLYFSPSPYVTRSPYPISSHYTPPTSLSAGLLPIPLHASRSPSPPRQSYNPLQLLINANILRPCQTWRNFKFDTDAILLASFSGQK